jgi:2,3-bisphosphoglycerate-dependent phosphoglycerate mutase
VTLSGGAQTRFLLIRHAHVDTGARLCGTLDLPLSDRGRAQLTTLLQGRATSLPDALYTSPLLRAREVAAGLADAWSLPAEAIAAVREISCGWLEGVPFAEVQARYPQLWICNEQQADDAFKWPGGESYRTFRARVLSGLQRIAQRNPGRRVAIVTHAGVITQILGTIRGRSAAVWKPDRPAPLTATEVTWLDGTPGDVLSYNDSDWY